MLEEASAKEFFLSKKGIPTVDEFQNALAANKKIIIPLVLKGGLFKRGIYSRDHITTLIIDPNAKKIIYIDPKGETLYDHRSHKVLMNFDDQTTKTVTEVFTQVLENILMTKINPPRGSEISWTLDSWKLEQNRGSLQGDGYNCGIYFFHNAFEYVTTGKIPEQLKGLDKIRECRGSFISLLSSPAIPVISKADAPAPTTIKISSKKEDEGFDIVD